jgi:hypothetical protein
MHQSLTQSQRLVEEVLKGRKKYVTDSYAMSVGELVSMYKDNELILNPLYQRFFKWTNRQQSALIESILIGVPQSPIMVYQTEDGAWEVVDGVQRLLTIFAFMGVLRPESRQIAPIQVPSILEKTKMLPALEGLKWKDLPASPLQLDFKRTKIEVRILKNDSDKDAKFEMFQRFHNGSSLLSQQEFRNCLLQMINETLFQWTQNLAENKDFKNCIDLPERLEDQRYDQELIWRLFVFALYPYNEKTISDYLDDAIFNREDAILPQYLTGKFDLEFEKAKFEKLFHLLNEAKGATVFKKNIGTEQKFLEAYFEAIAIGLYHNLNQYEEQDVNLIRSKIDKMEKEGAFSQVKGFGEPSVKRLLKTVPFGKKYFKK